VEERHGKNEEIKIKRGEDEEWWTGENEGARKKRGG